MPFFQSVIFLKIVLILIVGVLSIKKSLVLDPQHPMIEVHLSEADYIIALLVQAVFYLASNWAQVSLACMHVKKHWFDTMEKHQ